MTNTKRTYNVKRKVLTPDQRVFLEKQIESYMKSVDIAEEHLEKTILSLKKYELKKLQFEHRIDEMKTKISINKNRLENEVY